MKNFCISCQRLLSHKPTSRYVSQKVKLADIIKGKSTGCLGCGLVCEVIPLLGDHCARDADTKRIKVYVGVVDLIGSEPHQGARDLEGFQIRSDWHSFVKIPLPRQEPDTTSVGRDQHASKSGRKGPTAQGSWLRSHLRRLLSFGSNRRAKQTLGPPPPNANLKCP